MGHFKEVNKIWLSVLFKVLPILFIIVGPVGYAILGLKGLLFILIFPLAFIFEPYRRYGFMGGVGTGLLFSGATALLIRIMQNDPIYHLSGFLILAICIAIVGGFIVKEDFYFSFLEILKLVTVAIIIGFVFCFFILKWDLWISILSGIIYIFSYIIGIYLGKFLKPGIVTLSFIYPYLKAMFRPLVGFLFIYFSISLIFAGYYWSLYKLDQNHFKFVKLTPNFIFFDFIYFSITTITTLGYGDITPLSILARMVSSIEVIVGVVWITVGFAAVIAYLQHEFQIFQKTN